MSNSKWVNRNLPSGPTPSGPSEQQPVFRREYGLRSRSRRDSDSYHDTVNTRRNQAGTWVFVLSILFVCLVITYASFRFLRGRRAAKPGSPTWEQSAARFLAPDNSPEPIPHNPVEVLDRFLFARSKGALAMMSRDDDNSTSLIQQHGAAILTWLEGHREWIPGHEAKANGILYSTFVVNHHSEPSRIVYVVQTPAGPKIDIGAFLGWSSEDWANLVSGRATSAAIVRGVATRANYFNYRFTDDQEWGSYALSPLDGGPPIYGYARRGTLTAKALEQLVAGYQGFLVTVSLEDGERDSPHRQFRISRVIAAGWAIGPEIFEDFIPQFVNNPAAAAPNLPGVAGTPEADVFGQ